MLRAFAPDPRPPALLWCTALIASIAVGGGCARYLSRDDGDRGRADLRPGDVGGAFDGAGGEQGTSDRGESEGPGPDRASPGDGPRPTLAYACSVPPGSGGPLLPAAIVDTVQVTATGTTREVLAGQDLQLALDAAKPGDVIRLTAGATFTGNFVLPKKVGTGWIIIRTSTPDAQLPAPGSRVTPAHASKLARIVTAKNLAALTVAPGAANYRLIGLEVHPAAGVDVDDLVSIGTGGETSTAELPSRVIIDRCYVHADPTVGGKRGVRLNGTALAVIDSHISDFRRTSQYAQAVGGWNGTGPYRIVNNFLSAAGTSLQLGGQDPSIPDLVTADVEVCRNHLFKSLSWKKGDPSYAGTPWLIGDSLLIEGGRRLLISDNVIENGWADGALGFAVQIRIGNAGAAPWMSTEHLTLVNNIIRRTAGGVSISGTAPGSQHRTSNLLFYNNLLHQITTGSQPSQPNPNGHLFQIIGSALDLTLDHITGFAESSAVRADGLPITGFRLQNSILGHGSYGIIGAGTAEGLPTLTAYFPGAVLAKNVLIGFNTAAYPTGNYFPATPNLVGFVNAAAGDYGLNTGSIYKAAASDGKDIGVDMNAIKAATAGVVLP